MSEEFHFDMQAKRKRLSDETLIAALQLAAKTCGETYFTSTKYNSLPGEHPHSATIIERFGSWKKALALIGIAGGRERRYSPDQLIDNLEKVWKELSYPPSRRQIAKYGEKISEGPYRHHWGSVHAACKALEAFHNKTITREQLLAKNTDANIRTTVPLKDRWAVLKRDHYRCKICGASPSSDHQVKLEIDHIIPVAEGGRNDIGNLQTLCQRCNQGKKNR